MSLFHIARPALLAAFALALTACTAAPPVTTTGTAFAPKGYALQAIRAVGKHKGDYLPAHNFKLEIDGVIAGGFGRVGGVDAALAHQAAEYRDGDDPITHKRAGKAKYKNITLKRGFVNDASLLEWYKKVLAGQTDRKSGSVIYLDRAGAEVLRVSFQAWPTAVTLAEGASKEGLIVEELELAVEKVVVTEAKGEVRLVEDRTFDSVD